MESSKIENLLDAYFEGQSSLEDEAILMDYFCSNRVANHLIQYKAIFVGLAAMKKEQSQRPIVFPESEAKMSNRFLRYAVVGALLVSLGVGGIYFSQTQMSQEEKEALIAFEQSKEALLFLSEKLNKGTNQLSYMAEFGNTKNMVFRDEE